MAYDDIDILATLNPFTHLHCPTYIFMFFLFCLHKVGSEKLVLF